MPGYRPLPGRLGWEELGCEGRGKGWKGEGTAGDGAEGEGAAGGVQAKEPFGRDHFDWQMASQVRVHLHAIQRYVLAAVKLCCTVRRSPLGI
jgi:hypothetical protein